MNDNKMKVQIPFPDDLSNRIAAFFEGSALLNGEPGKVVGFTVLALVKPEEGDGADLIRGGAALDPTASRVFDWLEDVIALNVDAANWFAGQMGGDEDDEPPTTFGDEPIIV